MHVKRSPKQTNKMTRLLKAFVYVKICKCLTQFYDAISGVGNNNFLGMYLNLIYQIKIKNMVGEEGPLCS